MVVIMIIINIDMITTTNILCELFLFRCDMIAQCPNGEDEEGCVIPDSVRQIMSLFFNSKIVFINFKIFNFLCRYIYMLPFSNQFCWLGKLMSEASILNLNNHQPNMTYLLSSSSCTQPGWRSCSRSSPTSLPRSSPRSLAMALLR